MIDLALQAALRQRLATVLRAPSGDRRPFLVDEHVVGWLDTRRASLLLRFERVFTCTDAAIAFAPGVADAATRTSAMQEVAFWLRNAGELTAWRNEMYAVGPAWGKPALFTLERAAARYFGVVTYAAHVNGLVAHEGQLAMWLARRSPRKAIDPGLLDNLVGGGIRAGDTVADTVIREAAEEAGIAASVAARARPAGVVTIRREQPDGLQREIIFSTLR